MPPLPQAGEVGVCLSARRASCQFTPLWQVSEEGNSEKIKQKQQDNVSRETFLLTLCFSAVASICFLDASITPLLLA
jgi:hypothetical protein